MHIDVAVVDSHARARQGEAAVPNASAVIISALSAAELKPSIQFAELIQGARGRRRDQLHCRLARDDAGSKEVQGIKESRCRLRQLIIMTTRLV